MSIPSHGLPVTHGRGLHFWSLATLIAAFPLIFMGGLVTSHGAGLSVPDWPNSYGYNMFLFPPSMWVGGIFYEHTHRLLGTLVGLLAIGMVLSSFAPSKSVAWRRRWGRAAALLLATGLALLGLKLVVGSAPAGTDGTLLQKLLPHLWTTFISLGIVAAIGWASRSREPRGWVRWTTVVLLLAIILQGIKGGLRVEWVNIELAIVHGVFAQIILCLMAVTCLVTSRSWLTGSWLPAGRPTGTAAVAWTGVLATVLVLGQLVAGASMRHLEAGLAIPDLPLAFGKVLPPTTAEGLAEANRFRISLAETSIGGPVTLGQVWLHFTHRVGAVLVTAAVLGLIYLAVRSAGPRVPSLRRLAWLLLPMLLVQVTLGLATVYFRKPADITTLHHTLGALTLMVLCLLTVRAMVCAYGRTPAVATTPDLSSPTASPPVSAALPPVALTR